MKNIRMLLVQLKIKQQNTKNGICIKFSHTEPFAYLLIEFIIRIQEMIIAETKLRKQLDEVKKKSVLEKDQLHNIHAEEKLELMKV